MFKGIIQEIGEICDVQRHQNDLKLSVKTSGLQKASKIGDSISIDGACFTFTDIIKNTFTVSAGPETVKRTIVFKYKKGTKVNLELPLKLSDRIDGHLVQGHVDAMGKVIQVIAEGLSKRIAITFTNQIARYLAFKGSVAVNGVSLTISNLMRKDFNVSLIPHTLQSTNLNLLKAGSLVNLEVDFFARYIEKMLQEKEKTAKYEWLAERNLI